MLISAPCDFQSEKVKVVRLVSQLHGRVAANRWFFPLQRPIDIFQMRENITERQGDRERKRERQREREREREHCKGSSNRKKSKSF